MFSREYPVIDSAVSVEQLRMRLKDNELEQYGEPLTPDFVYDIIRQLPRFSSMRVSRPIRSPVLNCSAVISRMPKNSLASCSKSYTMNVLDH